MDEQSKDNGVSTLQWPDYLLIGVMLSISTGIGIYYRFTGGRQRTAEEYFSANRSMGAVPLSIGLAVSFVSAITLLGISAENYAHGTQIMVLGFCTVVATPITLYFYLPVFTELNTMSVYEYLEKRFGMRARLLVSVANFIQLLLYTGIVLFAPSLALEATTGLSSDISVLLVGLICTAYSTIGGIKAVLVTDILQGALMFLALISVLIVAAGDLDGGLSKVWSISQAGDRIEFFDFRIDPTVRHTWWSVLIGGTAIVLSLFAVNQVQVQRLLTAKSVRTSQYALILCSPIMLSLTILTSFAGLALYAVYRYCDPVTSGKISSFDKIMPYFAANRMSRIPGLTGLFISGVFSASFSTISATLNSLAAVAVEDYVKPVCRRFKVQFPTEKATMIAKGFALLNGVNCLTVAYLARSMGSLVEAVLGITGAIGGPILGIFTLGMVAERANETGAIIGTISALTVCVWAVFGKPKPIPSNLPLSVIGCENFAFLLDHRNTTRYADDHVDDPSTYFYLYRISYLWYNPLGMTITMLVGYLASLIAARIVHKNVRESDPRLFMPFVANRIKRRRRDAQITAGSQVFVLENRK